VCAAFEWAFALDPTNKELLQCIAECKVEIEKHDWFEHFNAQYLPQSEQAVESQVCAAASLPDDEKDGPPTHNATSCVCVCVCVCVSNDALS
jgi:hypothetical protein